MTAYSALTSWKSGGRENCRPPVVVAFPVAAYFGRAARENDRIESLRAAERSAFERFATLV